MKTHNTIPLKPTLPPSTIMVDFDILAEPRCPELNVGDRWHVIVPGSRKVRDYTIKQLTSKTVLFEEASSLSYLGLTLSCGVGEVRYMISDVVKWVERVDTAS